MSLCKFPFCQNLLNENSDYLFCSFDCEVKLYNEYKYTGLIPIDIINNEISLLIGCNFYIARSAELNFILAEKNNINDNPIKIALNKFLYSVGLQHIINDQNLYNIFFDHIKNYSTFIVYVDINNDIYIYYFLNIKNLSLININNSISAEFKRLRELNIDTRTLDILINFEYVSIYSIMNNTIQEDNYENIYVEDYIISMINNPLYIYLIRKYLGLNICIDINNYIIEYNVIFLN